MNVEELFLNGQLSVRTKNICKIQGWKDLKDIFDFYQTEKSFQQLSGCGPRVHNELLDLCKNYETQNIDPISLDLNQTKTLDAIFALHKVSNHTYEICRWNDLETKEDLIAFYKKNRTFRHLLGADLHSNQELIFVAKKLQFESQILSRVMHEQYREGERRITALNDIQSQLILYRIENYLKSMPPRAVNVFKIHLNHDLSLMNIYQHFLDSQIQLKNLMRSGMATSFDLTKLREEIWRIIAACSQEVDSQLLKKVMFIEIIQNHFDYAIHEGDHIFIDNTCLLFKLMEKLLKRGKLLGIRLDEILMGYAKVFQDRPNQTYQSLSIKLGITRERVRQLYVKTDLKLSACLKILTSHYPINQDYFELYQLDAKENLIIVDSKLTDKINQTEYTDFDQVFITTIIGILLNSSHGYINESSLFSKMHKRNHSNDYFVSLEFLNRFDFNLFFNEIRSAIYLSHKNTVTLDLNDLILKFKKPRVQVNNFKHILVQIIEKECRLPLINDKIVLKGFIKKIDFIVEILEAKLRPMHITEIMNELQKIAPTSFQEISVLRTYCNSFMGTKLCYIGRSSTYALKNWELTDLNFKSGTIRDLAEEYLRYYNVPQPIPDVVQYILIYRPTSSFSSIISNLRIESSGRFDFSVKGKIGVNPVQFSSRHFIT